MGEQLHMPNMEMKILEVYYDAQRFLAQEKGYLRQNIIITSIILYIYWEHLLNIDIRHIIHRA